jgi:hypothetical protein
MISSGARDVENFNSKLAPEGVRGGINISRDMCRGGGCHRRHTNDTPRIYCGIDFKLAAGKYTPGVVEAAPGPERKSLGHFISPKFRTVLF